MTITEMISLLGGVGLFLFGMSIMSTGLKNSCGDNLQIILEKATTNKFVAVLVGLIMTFQKGTDQLHPTVISFLQLSFYSPSTRFNKF